MNEEKRELICYRLERAKETLEDAGLLIEGRRWNSAMNRLYYSAFYAVLALLLNGNYRTTTHNGAKSKFSEHFIKTEKLSLDFGRKYSQLFSWRQKGDYADLFAFTEEKALPYREFVKELISRIEQLINEG
jgi:uncharacterized protein (UPF0332 family)